MGKSLKDQLLTLLVCSLCESPVEFDQQDKVWRHKEPLLKNCKRNGYPVDVKIGKTIHPSN